MRRRTEEERARWVASVEEWKSLGRATPGLTAEEAEAERIARSLQLRLEYALIPPDHVHGFAPWPPLSDEDRDTVHQMFEAESEARTVRVEKHRKRLEGVARFLAREVRAHRVTIADAEHQLEGLARPKTFPVDLINYRDACELVTEAFAATWRGST